MKAVDQAYQRLVARIGKDLGLGPRASEATVVGHCVTQLESFLKEASATPKNLGEVLNLCAARLEVAIREIRSEADMKALLTEFPPREEAAMARIPGELVEGTDAIVLQRFNRKQWEQPYLAVINCMGDHLYRRYFSKWHEIAHLLLEGRQIQLQFRKTDKDHKAQPLERLVDRVAGQLAFLGPVFEPVLSQELSATGRLTFAGVERVRAAVVPEASRQATTYACVRNAGIPIAYARFGMGLKKAELENLETPDMFPATITPATPKLRVKEISANDDAGKLGLNMFKNMSIAGGAIAARVFEEGGSMSGVEDAAAWRDGASGIRVHVEAMKQGEHVHCLFHVA